MQKPKKKREASDNYPTPQLLAFHCVDRIKSYTSEWWWGPQHQGVLIEPSAGSGVFAKEMRRAWPNERLILVEKRKAERKKLLQYVEPSREADVHCPAYFEHTLYGDERLKGIVIGNPPFKHAQEHIEHCFEILLPGSIIAFLLRLSFLGGVERNETFWKHHKHDLKFVFPIISRPSFVRGKSDNSEYGLYLWEVGSYGEPIIGKPIYWKDPT